MNDALVLIVDDEKDLRSLLDFNLRQSGYRTVQASNGAEAVARVASHRPDLILLDLNLPDVSGTEVCRQLKADPETEAIPIVMLTARGGEADRIAGFELGADDYVAKPFSVRELILRLEVVRRHMAPAIGRTGGPRRVLRAGPIEVDTEMYQARVGERELGLTLIEYRLLTFLLEGGGRVRTRDELLKKVWDYPIGSGTRTIETHVKRLRAKLGEAGDLIETVRSVGYRLRVEEAVAESGG
ncbi:MAG TPA: response regulator transcription factor [Polyangia bacterium]|nr:response regulator transcription factor [Polyangia bacterium]